MKKFIKKIPGTKYLIQNLSYKRNVLANIQSIEKTLKTLQIAAAEPYLKAVRAFTAQRQLSFMETLTYIREHRVSFARFGDGELKMMFRVGFNLKFQKNSAAIRMALRNTVTLAKKKDAKVLIGFPNPYGGGHWSPVWVDIWNETENLFQDLKTVGNAHVSRPIFFENFGKEGLAAWKSIWDQKSVTVVTGRGSRFNQIPELFENVKSLDFCYSKPTNGFEDLDNILRELDENNKSDLILISLGPAGTVLAGLLAERGKWALDVGHISDSYQTVFEGAAWPERKSVVSR